MVAFLSLMGFVLLVMLGFAPILGLMYWMGRREEGKPAVVVHRIAAGLGVITIAVLPWMHTATTTSTAIALDRPTRKAISPLRLIPLAEEVVFDVHLKGPSAEGTAGETVKHWWTSGGVPYLRIVSDSTGSTRLYRGAFRDSLHRAVFLIPNDVAYSRRLMFAPLVFYFDHADRAATDRAFARLGLPRTPSDSAFPYIDALPQFNAPKGMAPHWPIQMAPHGRHGMAAWNWRRAAADTLHPPKATYFESGLEVRHWWQRWLEWLSLGRRAAIGIAFGAVILCWLLGHVLARWFRSPGGRRRFAEGLWILLAATVAFAFGAMAEGKDAAQKALDRAPPRFDMVDRKILIEFSVARGDGSWPTTRPDGPALGMCSKKCGEITPRGAFVSESDERAVVAIDTSLVLNDPTLAIEPEVFTVEPNPLGPKADTTWYYADKALGGEFPAGPSRDGKWHVVLEPKAGGALYAHRWDADLGTCPPQIAGARHTALRRAGRRH